MPINFSPAQRKKHRETEFLYFDLETFTSADGTLIPNLAVLQNGFGECVYYPKSNEPIGTDISDELWKFLISPQFHNCHNFTIAHNFSNWREIFMEISGGICPFNAGLTIASLVRLVPKIKENKGMRCASKLFLNSFWGRLDMQENRSNYVFINEPLKFYEMLSNGKNFVSGWNFVNDDVVTVQFEKKQSFWEENSTTNVILAAFTTCWNYAYRTNDGKHLIKIKGSNDERAVRRLDADLKPLLMSKRYSTMETRYRTMPYGSYDKLAFAYQRFHPHDFEYPNDNKKFDPDFTKQFRIVNKNSRYSIRRNIPTPDYLISTIEELQNKLHGPHGEFWFDREDYTGGYTLFGMKLGICGRKTLKLIHQ
ncbi:hypothetical protein BV898_12536 [Hypsibius exemplaris]|uniref:DNA-directed DNA polymerase n=1 Tax=Hypsibius exemplaris TaxID=2072580 RepID=A0A1W0WDG8_HYPEX|nr:hypothetical protein BV898_12536 [Hypsibius exemplaris]